MDRGVLSRGLRHGWRIASNQDGGRGQSWRRVKYAVLPRFTPLALTVDEDMEFLVATDDKVIGRDLYVGTSHEVGVSTMRPVIDLVAAEVGQDFLAGRTFVDVGANIGTTSIAAVRRFGASGALCVEPAPSNLRLLRCNTILNDVADVVEVVAAAVAATEGEVELELSPGNHGDHRVRLSAEPGTYGEQDWSTIRVPAVRLDTLLLERALEPDDISLFWIDVEGFEAHVLESAGAYLGRVPCVIEFVPYFLRRSGGIGLLDRLVSDHFTSMVDARSGLRRQPGTLEALAADLGDSGWTDLILVP
jgi:FkbM family methyltransferase